EIIPLNITEAFRPYLASRQSSDRVMDSDNTEEIVKPEVKLAEQFVKYADLIVAFVVLQSLTFSYALGQTHSELRAAIVNGRPIILWLVVCAGLFYGGLIWFCAYWERSLRRTAGHGPVVLTASCAASLGRAAIVVAACFVAWYGLFLNSN